MRRIDEVTRSAWPTFVADECCLSAIRPEPQWTVDSGEHEIIVGRQQGQAMTNAKLRDQGVDRADLNAMAPAGIAQCRGFDMVLAVGRNHRQRSKAFDNLLDCARAREALQQLLQDDARSYHDTCALQGQAQCTHLWQIGNRVAAQRE